MKTGTGTFLLKLTLAAYPVPAAVIRAIAAPEQDIAKGLAGKRNLHHFLSRILRGLVADPFLPARKKCPHKIRNIPLCLSLELNHIR